MHLGARTPTHAGTHPRYPRARRACARTHSPATCSVPAPWGATWVVARAPGVPNGLARAGGEPSMVLRGSRKDWPPAAASKRYRRRWEGGGSPLAPSHLGTFCPRAVLVEQDALARPGGFQSVFQLQPRGRSSRFWGGEDGTLPTPRLPCQPAPRSLCRSPEAHTGTRGGAAGTG